MVCSHASLVNMMVQRWGSMSTSMMASLKASIARIRLLVWLCSFTLSLTCAAAVAPRDTAHDRLKSSQTASTAAEVLRFNGGGRICVQGVQPVQGRLLWPWRKDQHVDRVAARTRVFSFSISRTTISAKLHSRLHDSASKRRGSRSITHSEPRR